MEAGGPNGQPVAITARAFPCFHLSPTERFCSLYSSGRSNAVLAALLAAAALSFDFSPCSGDLGIYNQVLSSATLQNGRCTLPKTSEEFRNR